MSVTIKDCLQLPSLSLGSVIAGEKGIDSIVNTVSVVEFDTPGDSYSISNELLLSALYSIKDDVDAQCRALEEYKKCGEVGLVLFYADRILERIDDKLIETANRLNFPIIVLPGADMGLRYSDVISEVMEAVFMDKKTRNFFVDNTLERLSQLSPSKRTINSPLALASDYAKASFFLCDGEDNLIGSSYWPKTNAVSFSEVLCMFSGKADKYTTLERDGQLYRYYKHPFTNKDGARLFLLAVSKNNRLTSAIMEQVVEIIQLFAAVWNYNLNLTAKESLIPALIEGDLDLAEHICQDHLISLSEYDAFAILSLNKDAAEKTSNERFIKNLRERFYDIAKSAIIDSFANYIIFLFSYSNNLAKDHILLDEVVTEINRFEAVQNYALFSNIGSASQVRHLYISYTEHIETAMKIYPRKSFFNKSEIDFAGKCRAVISSLDGETEKYLQMLSPLIGETDEELLLTLTTYFLDADAEVKKTAELLYVHRNTIQYRLARIKNLINMDFGKFPMSFDIYMAVALERVLAM